MAGKRRFDPRRAKIHRNYTVEETARLFAVHRQTVRNWIKAGLPTMSQKRPTLILGRDLREFHQRRRDQNKKRCGPGELYCLRCREPRRPAGDMLDYIPLNLVSGNLRGICPTCEALIHRRVSLVKLEQVRGPCAVAHQLDQQRLVDTSNPSPHCHFEQADIKP